MNALLERMRKKALKSRSKFLICAVAFSKKNSILGINFSRPSSNRHCLANHAETGLILSIGGNKIDRILVCRVGRQGNCLPIDPCKGCQNIADRFKIKIETVPAD